MTKSKRPSSKLCYPFENVSVLHYYEDLSLYYALMRQLKVDAELYYLSFCRQKKKSVRKAKPLLQKRKYSDLAKQNPVGNS